jgi:hypothetical protein
VYSATSCTVGVKREAGKTWLRECAGKFGLIPRQSFFPEAEGLGQPPPADTFSTTTSVLVFTHSAHIQPIKQEKGKYPSKSGAHTTNISNEDIGTSIRDAKRTVEPFNITLRHITNRNSIFLPSENSNTTFNSLVGINENEQGPNEINNQLRFARLC